MPKIDYEIPVYQSPRYKYIRVSDLKQEDRGQLERWIFGFLQPLIYSNGCVILDAIFFEDYESYLRGEKQPLTNQEKCVIMQS